MQLIYFDSLNQKQFVPKGKKVMCVYCPPMPKMDFLLFNILEVQENGRLTLPSGLKKKKLFITTPSHNKGPNFYPKEDFFQTENMVDIPNKNEDEIEIECKIVTTPITKKKLEEKYDTVLIEDTKVGRTGQYIDEDEVPKNQNTAWPCTRI